MNTILLTFLLSQTPAPTVPLWAGKAPLAVGDSADDKPHLHVYLAPKDKATGAAAVICPGGGYGHLAMDHEGKQVAEFLNGLGIHGFGLQYRIATKDRPGPLMTAPFEVVPRALRMVRSWEKEHGINPKLVGVVGFSAGGHLASTAGTHFDAGKAKSEDLIDTVSCKPEWMALGYPACSLETGVGHAGSKKNLFGDKPDAKMVELYSNEKQVTKETPPTFIFHTSEDRSVLPENTIRFFQACKKANVPVELHMFERGRHGVGMNPKTGTPTDKWGERLADWLVMRQIGKK
jgi:acetyl esterase/lipase